MTDGDRYRDQADAVLRLAAKATSAAEKDVYLSIAEGWCRLAVEAERTARRRPPEPRSFTATD